MGRQSTIYHLAGSCDRRRFAYASYPSFDIAWQPIDEIHVPTIHPNAKASRITSGRRAITHRYAAAGASGTRRPCSQFFNVDNGIR